MSRMLVTAAVMLCAWGWTAEAKAQNLSRRDRALIYYNYYQDYVNSRKILRNQTLFRENLSTFREAQQQSMDRSDPIERYLREGRMISESAPTLPPIYSGRRTNRQYFMRSNYFGTVQYR